MTTIRKDFSQTFQQRNLQYMQAPGRPVKTSRIGFLLLENFSLPCFTQALDVLTTANLIRPGAVKVHTFSQHNNEVMSDLAIPIRPDTPLTDVRMADLDLMLVCGGLRTPRSVPERLSNLLRRLAALPMSLGGLWNGAWFLGRAGLLDGYHCAIHSEQRIALAERSPNTIVTTDSVAFDRDRLTAATPAGAFDMMSRWLARDCDPQLANAVIETLDYDQTRHRRTQGVETRKLSKPLREVVALMEANLDDPLEPDRLAHCAGLSKRQIQRLFRDQLSTSPQKYYLQLRVTEARRLIQNSGHSMIDVAIACGFATSSHFSKCYSDFFGYPPSREMRHEL